MLTAKQILTLFEALNQRLREEHDVGEIGIVGGAVMCLVFAARDATKDVDAVFEPAQRIRALAAEIGAAHGVDQDWLNDAAKGFIQPGFLRESVLELSHLRVWAPEARYMLAMKCISARWDTNDKDDVIFLIRHLKIESAGKVFEVIEKYYPGSRILPKTRFFIEELFDVPAN